MALGDVLSAAGEAAEALAAAEAAGGQGRAGVAAAGGDGVQGLLAAAEGHYRGALERGYGAALAIRRAEPEALVGGSGPGPSWIVHSVLAFEVACVAAMPRITRHLASFP